MSQIKVFILLIALFLWLPLDATAAQWARISAEKAVLYADVEMSSPIGWVKKGQKIRVGDVARNKGRLLPSVYKGKVVFVKVDDIQTNRDLALMQTATDRIREQLNKRERQDRIGLGYTGFSGSLDNGSTTGDGTESLFFTGAGVHGTIKKDQKPGGLKLKFDYLSASKESATITMLLMGIDYSYAFFRSEFLELGVFGGGTLSPYSQYKVDSLFTVNGYGAGVQGGMEVFLRIAKSLGVQMEAKYQYLKLLGFDLPESTSEIEVQDEFSPVISGPSFGAFLTYEF